MGETAEQVAAAVSAAVWVEATDQAATREDAAMNATALERMVG